MKVPDSSTASIASRTRGRSGAYCALTSIRGTLTVGECSGVLPGSRSARGVLGDPPATDSPEDEPGDSDHDDRDDEVVDVAERVATRAIGRRLAGQRGVELVDLS